MKIRTKASVLPTSLFKRECYKDIFRAQWWVNILILSVLGYGVYIHMKSVWITALVFEILYLLFWFIQVTTSLYIPQNAILFEKFSFIFSPENITLVLDGNRRSQIEWNQVLFVKFRKDYVIMFVSKIQFLYVPFSIFRSNMEKTMFLNLIKTKFPKNKIK